MTAKFYCKLPSVGMPQPEFHANIFGEVSFMNPVVRIPQGDDTVKVELTVKEIMALAGIKFHDNHKIEVSAKKKLNHVLEDQYMEEHRRLN